MTSGWEIRVAAQAIRQREATGARGANLSLNGLISTFWKEYTPRRLANLCRLVTHLPIMEEFLAGLCGGQWGPVPGRQRVCAGRQKGTGIAASPRVTGLRLLGPEGPLGLVSAACSARAGKGMRALRRSSRPVCFHTRRRFSFPDLGGPLLYRRGRHTSLAWTLGSDQSRSLPTALAIFRLVAFGPACAFPSARCFRVALATLPHPTHRSILDENFVGHPRVSVVLLSL